MRVSGRTIFALVFAVVLLVLWGWADPAALGVFVLTSLGWLILIYLVFYTNPRRKDKR